MEYYSVMKNEIMPFAAIWMQLKKIILSEVGQKEKDKDHMISMWNLKYDTNEHIYETRNRASLVAQWLRIRLPMQGTRVQSLVWEDAMGQLSP